MDIHKNCQKCRGTGQAPGAGQGTTTCNECGGTGRRDEGEISNASQTLDERLTDMEGKIDDALDKCDDILEKLNE